MLLGGPFNSENDLQILIFRHSLLIVNKLFHVWQESQVSLKHLENGM